MRNPQGDVSEAGPSLAVQASTGERELVGKRGLACVTPVTRDWVCTVGRQGTTCRLAIALNVCYPHLQCWPHLTLLCCCPCRRCWA